MGGLFIDVYIVWLFRSIQRVLRLRGTKGWKTVAGVVRAVYYSPLYSTVQVTYTYAVDGEPYAGISEKAFLVDNSAQQYQKDFVVKSPILIRVSPTDPNQSAIRDEDQELKPSQPLVTSH
jgi:hypothetical protein